MKSLALTLLLGLFVINLAFSQVTRTGSFVPGTPDYPISGDATFINNNGTLLVNFENNFSTVQGLDLQVYLSKTANLNLATDLQISTMPLDPGSSLGTPINGFHSFPIPSGVNLFEYNNVLVYCTIANVLWGYANLCESTLTLAASPLPTDTYFAQQDIISSATLAVGSNVTFETQNSITLNPNFQVPTATDFETVLGVGEGCVIE